jgi:hypothetical protein
MAVHVKKGDKIKGDRIQCEARKISNPISIPKSGRHKTQQIILRNNAGAYLGGRILAATGGQHGYTHKIFVPSNIILSFHRKTPCF